MPTMDEDFDMPDESSTLKVAEEKEIGKDGLVKKLVTEGQSWETQDNGDEVEDGFGEKGKPASGHEGAVPRNPTLEITIESMPGGTVTEVTDHRKVLKETLKEGEGYEKPNEGAVVRLKIVTCTLQDGTIFLKKGLDSEEDLFEFRTDEEQVIEGLDKAMMKMKKGEVALLAIAPEYGFGSSESKQERAVVPPNSTLYYEVELVSFEKEKESCDMNTEEKIEAAGKKKEEGNALFKAGKYRRALKRYEKAVKYIEYDTSFDEEEKKEALKVTCNHNIAACVQKLKEDKPAEKPRTLVLERDRRNVKALYRSDQACINLPDLDLAELDIEKGRGIVQLEHKDMYVICILGRHTELSWSTGNHLVVLGAIGALITLVIIKTQTSLFDSHPGATTFSVISLCIYGVAAARTRAIILKAQQQQNKTEHLLYYYYRILNSLVLTSGVVCLASIASLFIPLGLWWIVYVAGAGTFCVLMAVWDIVSIFRGNNSALVGAEPLDP